MIAQTALPSSNAPSLRIVDNTNRPQHPKPKDKLQDQQAITIPIAPSLPKQLKQLYNLQRQSFLTFSRAHYELRLRRDSLFLAFEIYCHSLQHPLLQDISNWQLQCLSLFLAVKYEEIYPPTLTDIFQLLGIQIDRNIYRQYQKQIIQALDFNLNLPIMTRELDSSIGDTNEKQRYMALYMLEIAILASNIFNHYPRKQIIQAISLLAKRKILDYLTPELSNICKLLVSAKNLLPTTEPFVHLKYQHVRYCCVSFTPL